MTERKYLIPDEVAAILRVSNMTVYREIQAGKLPAIRVGKQYRVYEKALQEYELQASTL